MSTTQPTHSAGTTSTIFMALTIPRVLQRGRGPGASSQQWVYSSAILEHCTQQDRNQSYAHFWGIAKSVREGVQERDRSGGEPDFAAAPKSGVHLALRHGGRRAVSIEIDASAALVSLPMIETVANREERFLRAIVAIEGQGPHQAIWMLVASAASEPRESIAEVPGEDLLYG